MFNFQQGKVLREVCSFQTQVSISSLPLKYMRKMSHGQHLNELFIFHQCNPNPLTSQTATDNLTILTPSHPGYVNSVISNFCPYFLTLRTIKEVPQHVLMDWPEEAISLRSVHCVTFQWVSLTSTIVPG